MATEVGVSRGWIAGIETGKPGGTEPLYVARAGRFLGIDRREAFRMAGYNLAQVLELFGPANGTGQPQTMDEVVHMLGALHQRARELQVNDRDSEKEGESVTG